MKTLTFVLAVVTLLLLMSCATPQSNTQNQAFESLAKKYIEQYLEISPGLATYLGDHRYDNRIDDYTAAGFERKRKLHQTVLEELKTIEVTQLGQDHLTDYKILQSSLESALYELNVIKEYEWNPTIYNPGDYVYLLTARDFAPLKERLQNAKERIRTIPAILEAAKANLKNPPKIHTETAILQNKGTLSLIRDDLKPFLDQVPELKTEFAAVQAQAIVALEAYGTWLEKELLPKSNGDFRLGEALLHK